MRIFATLIVLALGACTSTPQVQRAAEATSLLGKPLIAAPISPDQRAKLEANLASAQAAFSQDPSEDNIVWLGRRVAYLGRYNDSISVFSDGLQKYPKSAKLYRHRGHRYLTIRRIHEGLIDLTQAALLTQNTPDEVEPDGAPNARNMPRSSLKSNIWYHLGLGHYFNGEFSRAYSAWDMCMTFARDNDDKLVSTSYWLYLSRKRAGDDAGADAVLREIRPDMDIIENHAYHRLLLCFKGELKPEQVGEKGDDAIANATIAYGLAVRKLIDGDTAAARADFERIVAGPNWAAFGYIAAEAELARPQSK